MKLADKSTILIVPDSFKGTLSSIEASQAIASAFESVFPNAKIHSLPLADGGEGSSSLIGKLVGAERREFETFGPLGERITSFLYYDQATFRAYIELAASSGLTLIKDLSCSAMRATTFGTGQLIKSAVASGAREIFLFLGGSATTDGGVGFAKALGYRFLDSNGEVIKSALEAEESRHEFEGEQLRRIAKVLPPPSLDTENVKLTGIADVKNPLFGERGAAYVYGPQKGASREMITELDTGLQNLADVCRRDLARDYSDSPGAGAAGGSGFGVLTFLKGELRSGAPFFLDAVGFDRLLQNADLVITGEGKVDSQSIEGKLLSELLERAGRANVPLISLCGLVELSKQQLEQLPEMTVFGIGRSDGTKSPQEALFCLALQVARIIS